MIDRTSFLAISLVPSLLSAQNTGYDAAHGDYLLLPETVVTASRLSEDAATAPYSLKVLTEEDLKNEGHRTLPEAFSDTPGVMVQKTTQGHGSPFIRGFTGRQNLLLVDGVRLNNSTWRSGPIQYGNTIDAQALGRVELVKSQGSVLYGSDAIGGTVNALTRSTNFRDEEVGYFAGGSLTYSYNTNARSRYGRLEQRFGEGGKWGALLGLSVKDFNDFKDSAFGRFKGSGYDELSIDFKFEYALSDSATFSLAHQYLKQDDIIRWHSTILSDPDGDGISWQHGNHFTTAGTDLDRRYDQERSLTYARYEEEEAEAAWLDSWSATLSFQDSQDSEHRVRSSGQVDDKVGEVQTYGFTFQGQSTVGEGNLLWGLDYYHDEVDSEGYRDGVARPQSRPVADDASYDTLGIYAQYQRDLGERLTATLGVRYTNVWADWKGYRPAGATADQAGSGSWDDLSLSARAQYELSDLWNLHAGISQAFRAPNLDDLTGTQLAFSGLNTNGSPDVDPEKYLTSELGARYRTDDFSFSVAGYYTHIDNAITRVDDGTGDLISTNGQEGYLYGIEVEAAQRFCDRWEFSGYASWQDGKTKAPAVLGGVIVEDTIHRLHPLTAGAALKCEVSDTLWVQGRVTAAAEQDNLNTLISDTQRIPANGTPGYVVTSLHAGWQYSECLSLNLTLDNLTDEDYRVHGSGINGQGRAAILSATWKW